jgi:hypothetical protein
MFISSLSKQVSVNDFGVYGVRNEWIVWYGMCRVELWSTVKTFLVKIRLTRRCLSTGRKYICWFQRAVVSYSEIELANLYSSSLKISCSFLSSCWSCIISLRANWILSPYLCLCLPSDLSSYRFKTTVFYASLLSATRTAISCLAVRNLFALTIPPHTSQQIITLTLNTYSCDDVTQASAPHSVSYTQLSVCSNIPCNLLAV